MICSTNCSNRTVLLVILFIAATSWGCSRYPTGSTLDNKDQRGVPSVDSRPLMTVLPVENLSSTAAPVKEIEKSLKDSLKSMGFRLLADDRLEAFRKIHRMRYTGGVSSTIGSALKKELKVDFILITSLEAFNEMNPPQISLISRLVTSGQQPEIQWIDSVGLSGDQSPGLFGLNRIKNSQTLTKKAVEKLTASLAKLFTPQVPEDKTFYSSITAALNLNGKYQPYDYFRSPLFDPERKFSIAVIPLRNLAVRKNAGAIASLHYVRDLFNLTNYKVIEPGLVREQLLRFRAIMPEGPSLAVADLITSEGSLGVDLILSGKMFDYQNRSTNPKVDFSVQVIEKNTREVVFGARTFSEGQKGVFFFNMGRVFTAHDLLQELTGATVNLLHPYRPWEGGGELIGNKTQGLNEQDKLTPETIVSARQSKKLADIFENY